MARRCSIDASKGVLSGHKVSHSNRKTKRKFLPNLQNFSFLSDVLGRKVSLRLSPSTARTIEHNQGIDNFLVNTSSLKLTEVARKLKKAIKSAILKKQA
jgi:large subunit ribosomal protein L28